MIGTIVLSPGSMLISPIDTVVVEGPSVLVVKSHVNGASSALPAVSSAWVLIVTV